MTSNRLREIDSEHRYNMSIYMLFELQEVEKLVRKAKTGKAPGLDCIIYEALENTPVIMAVVGLFKSVCFLDIYLVCGERQSFSQYLKLETVMLVYP